MSELAVDSIENLAGDQRFGPILSSVVDCSTGAATYDITSIPSWVKKITAMARGVSWSSNDNIMLQIGDAGGVEVTGYESFLHFVNINTGASGGIYATAGFTGLSGSTYAYDWVTTLYLADAATNLWQIQSSIGADDGATRYAGSIAGYKALSAALDRVRLTNTGAGVGDAGSFSIMYE